MATFKSDQKTNIDAVPPTRLKPNDREGRVRIARFSFTTPAGMAINDLVEACVLPKGARVVGARLWFEDLGVGATMDIGISGTAAKYASALAVAAVGQSDFANTKALNMLAETTAEEVVRLTDTGAGWTAAKKIDGYILYVKD